MALGRADLLHRPVAEGKVDLSRRPAGGFGGESRSGEEALRDAVVAGVFLEHREPSTGEPALSAEARDEVHLFERAEVRERRWRSHVESGGDLLEARAACPTLPDGDDPKGLDLSMRQSLERLHT